jgi:probable HAF family extracellular repeat protein
MQPLGTLPGGTISVARSINNAGQIAGYSKNAANNFHAVSYGNGTVNDLGTLGGTVSRASSINNSGQIVGDSFYQGNANQAFVSDGGPVVGLGFASLGGANESLAEAINDAGQIAGTVHTAEGYRAAVHANGAWMSLGTLPGKIWSQALAINNAGAVVGSAGSLIGGKGTHNQAGLAAFLYQNGSLLDLNQHLDSSGTGWTLKAAYDINDHGWIVGVGINPSGQYQSYLLIPVPEPGSLVLACTGAASLAVVSVVRFRNRRRSLQD